MKYVLKNTTFGTAPKNKRILHTRLIKGIYLQRNVNDRSTVVFYLHLSLHNKKLCLSVIWLDRILPLPHSIIESETFSATVLPGNLPSSMLWLCPLLCYIYISIYSFQEFSCTAAMKSSKDCLLMQKLLQQMETFLKPSQQNR